MGGRGDAYDNAAIESVISTIKAELVRGRSFATRDAARLAVFDYIETFYNPHRLHSALGNLSPAEFEMRHWPTEDRPVEMMRPTGAWTGLRPDHITTGPTPDSMDEELITS